MSRAPRLANASLIDDRVDHRRAGPSWANAQTGPTAEEYVRRIGGAARIMPAGTLTGRNGVRARERV
jgi:hypothetical protein